MKSSFYAYSPQENTHTHGLRLVSSRNNFRSVRAMFGENHIHLSEANTLASITLSERAAVSTGF